MSRWYENYEFECNESNFSEWLKNNIWRLPANSGVSLSEIGRMTIGGVAYKKVRFSSEVSEGPSIVLFKTGDIGMYQASSGYKIVDWEYNPVGVGIEEQGSWIEVGNGSMTRYCYVRHEKDLVFYRTDWSYGSDFGSPKSFKPHQPLSVDDLGDVSARLTVYERSINSQSGTPSWLQADEFVFDFSMLKSMPSVLEAESQYRPYYSIEYRRGITFQSDAMSLTVGGWDNFEEYVTYNGEGLIPVYAGIMVGNGFAKMFSVFKRKSNLFDEIETLEEDGIDVSKIETNVFSAGEYVEFSYKGLKYNGKDDGLIVLGLAKDWYSELSISSKYPKGSWFDIGKEKDKADAMAIKYEDGRKFPISMLNCDTSMATSLQLDGDGRKYIGSDVDSFTIEYSIKSPYDLGQSPTYTAYCESSEYDPSFYATAVLSERFLHFGYGQSLKFAEGSSIDFLNAQGVKIDSLDLDDPSSLSHIRFPELGTSVTDKTDGTITKRFTVVPFSGTELECSIEYTVDWYEDEMKAIQGPSKLKYYWSRDGIKYPSSLSFPEDEGLRLAIVLHNNSAGLGTKTETEVSDYRVSMPDTSSIESVKATRKVTASHETPDGQTAKYEYDVMVVRYEAESLTAVGGSDETKYYDSGMSVFHSPMGVTFHRIYTDGYSEEATELEYFRNEELTYPLIAGVTLVSKNDGDVLYVKDPVTGFSSSYRISWKSDPMVGIQVESPVTAFLGNKLSRIKQNLLDAGIVCSYESGATRRVSVLNEFEIKETSVIMSPIVAHIIVDGIEYALPNGAISFSNPSCRLALAQGIQTTYNNGVDAIRTDDVSVVAQYYEPSGTKCDYSKRLSASEISFEGNGKLASYPFDGATSINIDMEGQSEQRTSFSIHSPNEFSNETATLEVNVTIMEILNVTGIKLLKAKTDYKVGDEFLGDSDNTTVQIFYSDAQNKPKATSVRLNSGFTGLNIYPLKGTILTSVAEGKEITVSSVSNSNVKVQYSINVKSSIARSNTRTHNLVVLYIEDYEYKENHLKSAYYAVERTVTIQGTVKESTKLVNGIRVLNDGVGESDLEVLGYLEDIGDTSKSAKLVLFKDYLPPIDGTNNVTVKFPCYVEGNADIVNKSRFGIMFGNNNSKNRLFVSGNPDYPNMDWHSSELSSESFGDAEYMNGNFGYFGDTSECTYGETDNEVISYDIVSNDKLLVLKSASDKETTVYFRQPQLVTAVNGSGTNVTGLNGEQLYQEEFSLVRGNNSVAGTSPKAIANFNGDTVFISEDKQMCGLDLTGIIGDNQRYANSRSYYIDEDLKRLDLDGSFLWTDNEYLMLASKEKVYVTNRETRRSESGQYEWFVMNLRNVSEVFKKGDSVYLGTDNGELYRSTKGYEDTKKMFIGVGQTKVTVDDEAETLFVPTGEVQSLEEGVPYTFRNIPDKKGTEMYYSLGSIVRSTSADCDFDIVGRNIRLVARKNGSTEMGRLNLIQDLLGDNEPVYLTRIGSNVSGIESDAGEFDGIQGKRLWLVEDPFELDHQYMVKDDDGNPIDMGKLKTARLCKMLTGNADVVEINKSNNTFKLSLSGQILDLVHYGAQDLIENFVGEIVEHRNVEAYYITAPYTMGSLEYFKTIWSFTLTNDTNIPSETEVCYANNKIPYEEMKTLAKVSKDALGFDLESFNFNSVDFDKNVVPRTYTSKRVLSGVKFVCFGFRNYNGTNSVLSSMSVIYTTPYPSYSGD